MRPRVPLFNYTLLLLLQSLSLVQLFCPRGSSAMGFARQEYWNGLPFSSPGDLPDPGIEPTALMSPILQADSLPAVITEAHILRL